MSLEVFLQKTNSIVILRAVGEMDYHTCRLLRNSVEKSLAAGDRRFVFNLREVTYLDSSALGGLLYNQKKIEAQSGQSVIVPSQAITEILSLTHLDTYLNVSASVEEAKRLVAVT